MIARKIIPLVLLLLAVPGLARAAELVGKWSAEFDSQIGVQKYAFDFQRVEEKLTGKASFDHSMGQGTSPLKDIKVTGDDVTFIELLSIQGMDIVVTYTGKLVGDEMKLTREVGDFATEQIVVKRVPLPALAAPSGATLTP